MIMAMDKDLSVIQSQQLPNKLSIAGGGDYDKVWIRDNVYVALALAEAGHMSDATRIYTELLKIIKKYEHLLDSKKYPTKDSELLHPRFSVAGDIIPGNWGNKQHDAVGALLFGIGQIHSKNHKAFNDSQKQLCQKLVNYLELCRYWEDEDNGIWEESRTIHSSSLSACIKGIQMVSDFCKYNKQHLKLAEQNLKNLLPSESSIHDADMALLSLIWPYGYELENIVKAVEDTLLRTKGVIRHIGDAYEADGQSEPQWVMGIPWLGIAYYELGNIKKAKVYLKATEDLYTDNGLPESYLANNKACVHTPLAWSHAMAIVLRTKLATSVKN